MGWFHKLSYFLWKDTSIWSWIANILIAFVVIRYIFYPVMGILLGTSYPVVAVVSESMEHGLHNDILCGQSFDEFHESFDNYWEICGSWYEQRGITREQFEQYPFKNGFNKGDVIFLWRANRNNLNIGDVLVFQANKNQPIIHRLVDISNDNEKIFYQTKGDHNARSIDSGLEETHIGEERVYGQALFRIPYLGWVKILVVDILKPFGIIIVR